MKKTILALGVFLIGFVGANLFAQNVNEVACKNLSDSIGVGAKLITDLDYSKKKPVSIKNLSAEVAEFDGSQCIKISNEKQKMLRFFYLFDEPISTDNLVSMKVSIGGFTGWDGYWNIGLVYEGMNGSEHDMSCYTGAITENEFTDLDFNLAKNEAWNKNFKPGKKVIGIQFYSDQSKFVYIKNLELVKN